MLILGIGWVATFSAWQPLQMLDDKVRHIVAFFVLAGASFCAFPQLRLTSRLAALLLLGFAIETLQLLTPNREFHLDDLAASFAGACLFEFINHLRNVFRNL